MKEMSEHLEVCPRCGATGTDFLNIESGMRLALQSTEDGEALPSKVCGSCYSELAGKVSKGMKLRLEEQAKARNRQIMWKSRVNLIKQARQLMQQKSYSEAAVSYEKYIRVLEIAHDVEKGQLSPEVFNKSIRSKELTVVATAYWDLMRIYDTSSNYRDRMKTAATKLAQFLPYSPIFPDVVRRAESFLKTAKNPDIVKMFLKMCRKNRPRCFVATSVFKAPCSEEIFYLRLFRDKFLKKYMWGRRIICFYYQRSPQWVFFLEKKPVLKKIIKGCLLFFVGCLKCYFKRPDRSPLGHSHKINGVNIYK
ncbi:MAG: hypothetical protein D6797_09085 [Bdellovibrio sp.]|nr:MAG: hypothetical protein D6797_09085 [Bdellovibrio sp.]